MVPKDFLGVMVTLMDGPGPSPGTMIPTWHSIMVPGPVLGLAQDHGPGFSPGPWSQAWSRAWPGTMVPGPPNNHLRTG